LPSARENWRHSRAFSSASAWLRGGAITGIDDRNVGLLVKAVLRTSGRRQFP